MAWKLFLYKCKSHERIGGCEEKLSFDELLVFSYVQSDSEKELGAHTVSL